MARTRRSLTYQFSIISIMFSAVFFSAGDVRAGGQWLQMTGELGIGKTSIADPTPEMDSVAYLVIKGKAAEKIYKTMKTEPIFDSCIQMFMKKVGNLYCTKKRNQFACDVGINLETGQSALGRPC